MATATEFLDAPDAPADTASFLDEGAPAKSAASFLDAPDPEEEKAKEIVGATGAVLDAATGPGSIAWANDQMRADAPFDPSTQPTISETPTFLGELEKGITDYRLKDTVEHFRKAGSIAYETLRRPLSPVLGPTESERIEKSIPFGTDEQGNTKYEYKPLGSRLEREAGLMTPYLPLQRFEPKPGDTTLDATIKAAANTAEGIIGSLSPAGVMLPGASALPNLGRAAAGIFAVDMAAHLPGQIEQAFTGDTTQQKIEGALGALSGLAFGYLGAKHAVSGALEIPIDQLKEYTRAELAKMHPDGRTIPAEYQTIPAETLDGLQLAKEKLKQGFADQPKEEQVNRQELIDSIDDQLLRAPRQDVNASAERVRERAQSRSPEEAPASPVSPEGPPAKAGRSSAFAQARREAGIPDETQLIQPEQRPTETQTEAQQPGKSGAPVESAVPGGVDPNILRTYQESAERIAEQVAQGQPTIVREAARDAALNNAMGSLNGGKTPNVSFMRKSAQTAAGEALKKQGESIEAVTSEGQSIAERVAAPSSESNAEPLAAMQKAIDTALSERDAKILRDSQIEGKTYEAIAEENGISKQRVGQIIEQSLPKIRAEMERSGIGKEDISTGNDWTQATATPAYSAELGILPPGAAQMMQSASLLKGAVGKLVSAIRDVPKFHDFRRSILDWSARNQKASGEVLTAAKDITKAIPDATRREAITNWIQAGGDTALLQQRANATPLLKRKLAYEAATKLTPEEISVAKKIKDTYDILLQRARANGINISEIENYVNQIWKRQPLKEFTASSNRRLSDSVRFAKQRYYDSFFEGEQAGLKPQTKDISKLLPIYMNEVNNAIAAKQLVANLSRGVAEDGRPLVAPAGGASVIEDPSGSRTTLIFPDRKMGDTSDYVKLDQPALHGWQWRASDEKGNPTLVKSDLMVHPDIADQFKNILGQSEIRRWYSSKSENPLADIPKATVKFLVDDLQQIGKATMLGFLSPFHQVQEATHAIGHKINPFSNIPKIDLNDPVQFDAAQHGLMLLPDRISAQQFREGLDGSNRNLLANVIGKAGKTGERVKEWVDGYQNWLFHDYIPGLKLKTYNAIVGRNMERFKDDIASGKITEDQVKYLSAQQSNAAYGHLNYADIGRNPTLQHIAQTFLLAPDFLEARARFAGQAVKGLTSKSGREQLAALATLAATQFVVARILNKTLDDDYHWDHPFDVIVGNRRYTMRSVPEDMFKLYEDPRKFVSGRLSPLVGRGVLEGLSGVNYRGEPTEFSETLKNLIGGMVPLTVQPLTRGLSETGKDNPVSPIEQLIGSMGVHISRFSPVSEIYKLSSDWIKEHGEEYGLDKKRGVYPVSKYQQLRYALDDGDMEKAKQEKQKLIESEKISAGELTRRFRESMGHPFTGSQKTDEAFRKSLDKKGQETFDAAKKRRQILLQRYDSIR